MRGGAWSLASLALLIQATLSAGALVATRPATPTTSTLRPALRGIAPAELPEAESNILAFSSRRSDADASAPSDEVLPFVSIDANQSLALHPAALNALASAPAPTRAR